MRTFLVIGFLSLSACSSFKQIELEQALSAAQEIALSTDTVEAINSVLTEEPNARWACRALAVGKNIMRAMPIDFDGKDIILRLVSVAADLCPKVLMPTECSPIP